MSDKQNIIADGNLYTLEGRIAKDGSVVYVKKKYLVIDFDYLEGCDSLLKEIREDNGIPYKIVEVVELEE